MESEGLLLGVEVSLSGSRDGMIGGIEDLKENC